MLMPSLFNDNLFDGFFDGFFNDFAKPVRQRALLGNSSYSMTPAMRTDVKETDAAYELDIDLPGFKKEDVQAELKDGYLTISASTKTDKDEKDDNNKYIRRERYYGSCSRSFYVGDQVTEEDIKARFEDGILKLSVPKKQPEPVVEQKRYIAIEG